MFKYLKIGINAFKTKNIFSYDFILSFLIEVIEIYVLYYIWNYMGIENSLIYFWIANFVNIFVANKNILRKIDLDIRSGKFSFNFLFPIKIDLKYYFEFLFERSSSLLKIIFYLVFGYLIGINFVKIIILFPLILISSILSFYFFFIFFPISFKTEDSWGFSWMIEILAKRIFSGLFIPSPFLREILGIIYIYMPFKYFIGFIPEVYFKGFNLFGILISIFWLIFFYFLANIVVRKSLKNWVAYGL